MATTWGTNTWGSNSWESDLNTITPSSNTLSLTTGTLLAYPEQGWGGKQWGINEWGELTDVTVSLTGQELTLTLGNESVEAILNKGWGRKNWGEEAWGIGGSVLPQGQQLNTTLASVTVTNEINIGWGGLTWGAGEWGDLANPDIIQTGIEMTSNTEDVSITADANTNTTGQELTSNTDGVVAGTSVSLIATGEELTSDTDGVFAGELVTVELTSPSNDPWGNEVWGNGQWGVGDGTTIIAAQPTLVGTANIELTSNQLSISEGTVDPAPDAMVTGIGMTITSGVGTVTASASVNTTGSEATAETGDPTLIGTANIDVTGQELTGSTGQLEYEAKYLVTNGSENSVEFTAYNQAQLSTAQAKFGTASLLLDGTNDYVESNSNVDLSSGDFTVDVWIRPSSVSGYKGIWQSGTSTTEQSYLLGSTVYWTVNPSTIISSSVTVNANEWTMLSYERQGNTHRLYKNGTLEDTATTSNKQDNGRFSIGENGFGDFNGYIDEFRLSNIARYGGSSFTEPTGAFVPDSNTTFLLHMDGANGSTNIVDDAPGVTIARFDIGEAFGGEVVEVQVRTASAQPWGNEAWGNGEWGQSVGTDIAIGADTVLTPSIDVPVTGEDINTTAANVSITADANLSLTGQELESLLGDENAFSDVTVEITGQLLTSEQGDVLAGISQLIIPTGLEATVTSGTMGVNAWAVVDPNASTTWSVVDKAAA